MLIISVTILMSVHWSFSEGFGDYLLKAEAVQLDKLVTTLEQTYSKEGSWQALHDNPDAWFGILRQGLEEQHLPPNLQHPPLPDDFAPPEHHPPPPEWDHADEHHHPPPHLGAPSRRTSFWTAA
ncbi:MAG: hypothetical protein NTV00_04070 [Methylococcales bacterium]|nr:hypothetical protein [Methylococcales bacterium]